MYLKIYALLFLLAFNVNVQAALQVFTCEPEWKALVEELAGEKVQAFSATTAFQDPHHIEARPTLIAKVRNADLLICTGAGLEDAWLSLLVRQAGNKKITVGSEHYFLAATLIEKIEVPTKMDRSLGDIHGEGNPHVHLDPHRLLTIAQALSERLIKIDATNADFYKQRFEHFSAQWLQAIIKWEDEAQLLKNTKAIVYHRSWSYLLVWLDINEVGDLEPKPGIPPSTAHLVSLLSIIEKEKPNFILVTAYQDDKGARWLSEKSGVPVVTLPYTVGANAEANNLFGLFENIIQTLTKQVNQ